MGVNDYLERHLGFRFLLYSGLLVLPIIALLFASLFVSWTSRQCGPGYTELCGDKKVI